MSDNANRQSGSSSVATYFISNMDCVNEEKLIRERLSGVEGIQRLDFDLGQRRLKVTHALPSDEPLVAHLKAVGMRPVRVGPAA